MAFLLTKYALTAFLIVLISEVAKRSDKLGGLIAAMPMMTVLVMVWMYAERQPSEKIANHAWYTFWYVLPTLPMFLAFPWLLKRFGFWFALALGLFSIAVFMLLLAWTMRRFGVELI